MRRKSNLIHPLKSASIETLRNLESIFKIAFDIDTCYPDDRKNWTKDVPACGHCAVTALVVQDYLGGEIVYDQDNLHFWNRVEGIDLDFTRDQFEEEVILHQTRIRPREEILEGTKAEAAETPQRYQILSNRVKKLLFENLNDFVSFNR